MKQNLLAAIRLLAGAALVALLLSRADLAQLNLSLDGDALIGIGSAVLLLVLALALSSLRWRLVLGPESPAPRFLLRLYFIGWFFSLFLPTSVGGDAVRAVGVTRGTTRTGEALSSVVVERLLGLAALMLYLLVGFSIAPVVLENALGGAQWSLTGVQLLFAVAVAAAGGAGAAVLGRHIPRVRAAAGDAAKLWRRFRRSPHAVGGAMLLSLLVQGSYILVWYSLAVGLGLEIPALVLLVFVPLVSIAAMLPITLSGLGVREGVWALLLAPFGVSVADAIGFSLAYYGCSLVVGLVGGGLFAFSGVRYRSGVEDEAQGAPAAAATTVATPR